VYITNSKRFKGEIGEYLTKGNTFERMEKKGQDAVF
jgi:hypothetical protein